NHRGRGNRLLDRPAFRRSLAGRPRRRYAHRRRLAIAGQFPSLWKVGYKYRADFHWRDEGVRTVLTLMGPAVIAASAVQVNVLINSGFAASLGNGPVSWLNIAFRLMQLPLGIFGVAIGTVTLPL